MKLRLIRVCIRRHIPRYWNSQKLYRENIKYFFTMTPFDMGTVIVNMGHAVAQFVEALCCKSEGRRFDFRWCHWSLSLTVLPAALWPGVDSASNGNEYQEYFLDGKGGRCVGLTILQPSCADCLKIWEAEVPRYHDNRHVKVV